MIVWDMGHGGKISGVHDPSARINSLLTIRLGRILLPSSCKDRISLRFGKEGYRLAW